MKAAFNADGTPSKAALGFVKSCGLKNVDELQQLETDKGAWLVYDAVDDIMHREIHALSIQAKTPQES